MDVALLQSARCRSAYLCSAYEKRAPPALAAVKAACHPKHTTMETNTAPAYPDAEQELSPLNKLTASGLISVGFCLLGMLFLAYNRFDLSAASFTLLAFTLGGLILSGTRRWSPALGVLYCLLFLLIHGPALLKEPDSPVGPDFYLSMLLSPILLVTLVAGVSATVQNYRQPVAHRSNGLWLIHAMVSSAGLSLVVVVGSLYVLNPPQPQGFASSPSAEVTGDRLPSPAPPDEATAWGHPF